MSLRFSSLRPGDRIPLGGVLLEVRESSCIKEGEDPSCGKCWFYSNAYASFRCSTVNCTPNRYRQEYVEYVQIGEGGKK